MKKILTGNSVFPNAKNLAQRLRKIHSNYKKDIICMPYVSSGRLNISNLSIKKQVTESMYSIYVPPSQQIT